MSVFGRIRAAARALAGPPRRGRRAGRVLGRAFDAAKYSRFGGSWGSGHRSINGDLYHSLPMLVARSRNLWANNEYTKAWLKDLKADVVGPRGFGLQMQIRRNGQGLDDADNNRVEEAWKRWRKVGNYDTTGKLSGTDGEKLFVATVARDGEAIVRLRRGFEGSRFGYAVQFIDTDRLDVLKNDNLGAAPGNRVIMGVELTPEDRPVAYHLLQRHPESTIHDPYLRRGEHERVPADEILHCFIVERAEQVRGVPWAHAAITGLKDVDGYREAAIVAARTGASKLGWWRTQDADSGPYDLENSDGTKFTSAEPGTFGQIGPDDELVEWDPDYPHEQFGDFNRAMLQGISGALEGAGYHTISGDMEGVNFTTGRLGNQSRHAVLMGIQTWMQDCFLDLLFADWLQWMLATNQLGTMPIAGFERFNVPSWIARRWGHIQPREESAADAISYGLTVKSLTQIAAERGVDIDETHAQIARERQRLEALGITPTISGALQPAEPEQAEEA